ncbi:hypothetical protein P376_4932 [Streptomyces sp. HCCB10043]|nr:hypothetical protein P376_4932 [Streptomyces sp. HCCB10043]
MVISIGGFPAEPGGLGPKKVMQRSYQLCAQHPIPPTFLYMP